MLIPSERPIHNNETFTSDTQLNEVMDLVQLKHFLKIVECRSFTRAAAMSNVSQPALSQQIAKLEKELGHPLFVRQGRQIQLTPVGQQLRDRAERILSLVGDIEQQFKPSDQSNQLRLGTVPSVGPYFVTRMMQWLFQQHPQLDMALRELALDQVLREVERGMLDLAIMPQPAQVDRTVQVETLFEEEIKIVLPTSHRLAKKRLITLADLNGESLILLNEHPLQAQQLTDHLNEQQVDARVVTYVDQFLTLQHLVVLRQGISFLPDMAIPLHPKGNLCYRQITGTRLARSLVMCWSKERFQSAHWLRAVDAIRHYAQFKHQADIDGVDEKSTASAPHTARRSS